MHKVISSKNFFPQKLSILKLFKEKLLHNTEGCQFYTIEKRLQNSPTIVSSNISQMRKVLGGQPVKISGNMFNAIRHSSHNCKFLYKKDTIVDSCTLHKLKASSATKYSFVSINLTDTLSPMHEFFQKNVPPSQLLSSIPLINYLTFIDESTLPQNVKSIFKTPDVSFIITRP